MVQQILDLTFLSYRIRLFFPMENLLYHSFSDFEILMVFRSNGLISDFLLFLHWMVPSSIKCFKW
ncbi:hypothetical protein HanRHA438_Chr04g0182401 [Helianthus annuus]|nr:hypothetical protein HanRHA438_Chr04g0182401 [Helianthus annuus]